MNVYAWHWGFRRIFIVTTFVPVVILLFIGSLAEGFILAANVFFRNFQKFGVSLNNAWNKNAIYFRVVDLKKTDEDDYWGI